MKKLDISDKKLLEKYYGNFRVNASDINLSNLFMWEDKYNFHYTTFDGFLYIINVKDDNTWYSSQPIGDYSSSFEDSLRLQYEFFKKSNKDLVIKKADDIFVEKLMDMDFDFDAKELRNEYDYIYLYEDLVNLSGNKYHKKKNHVNKFIKSYESWHYESLSKSNIPDVSEFIDKWCMLHGCDEGLLQEKHAISIALDNFETLDLTGGILYIDSHPIAFTLGEKLNDNTLVIHIEKADTRYHGTYNMINMQYLNNQDEFFEYVNREQDLGIEGLRQAKLSYHPIGFIKKHTVYFK